MSILTALVIVAIIWGLLFLHYLYTSAKEIKLWEEQRESERRAQEWWDEFWKRAEG